MNKKIIFVVLLVVIFLIYYKREEISSFYKVSTAKAKSRTSITHFVNNKNPMVKEWYQQKIPLKIHQTSMSRNVNYKTYQACLTTHNTNPEYDYMFYTDDDCIEYIKAHFPQYLPQYNALIPGAFKADLFRLLLLYREGGVYLDCKSSSITPLREIIQPDDELYMMKDCIPGTIYQGAICSVPGHHLMKKFIDRYITNIDNKFYGINTFDIGGPQMIGRVFNAYLGRPELSPIESFSKDGIRISGSVVSINIAEDLIISDDRKTIYFERSNSTYLKNKIKLVFAGKCYGTRWFTRTVYQ